MGGGIYLMRMDGVSLCSINSRLWSAQIYRLFLYSQVTHPAFFKQRILLLDIILSFFYLLCIIYNEFIHENR